jgi:hypothetical protein
MIERFDPLKGERLRVLDEAGESLAGLDPGLPDAGLRTIYERLVRTRASSSRDKAASGRMLRAGATKPVRSGWPRP